MIDPTGAQRGARKVKKAIDQVGASADRTRQLIARAFSFTLIAAALTRGISLLANFEQQMASVRAISGATELQFASLREEAKRLGITTRFSASQAAEGMVFLARAGFEVDEVMGAIKGTLRLAQAGVLDVATAADIASNVLQGFRLDVAETGRVVDVLALAANSANTTVGQLGQGLKFVAPVAAGLGISLEETTAAMAALSDAGLQSTLAGTGLRRVLSELESPAKKTTDILNSLGLSAKDVRVSQVGLTVALQRLAAAGVDTGQALELFGDRGGPAFEVLTSSLPKVVAMDEKLRNAGGTAERIAKIMDDNLKGALFALRSALEGVIIELGDAGATGALEGLFRAMAAGLRGLARNIDVFVNVLETLIIALGVKLATGAIPAAIAGVRALGVAIIANPIGLFVTGIVLAVSALLAFGDEISVGEGRLATLDDVATATFEAIGEAVGALATFFAENFGVVADVMRATFGDVELSIEGVLRVAARVVDGLIGFFVGAKAAVLVAFEDLPAALEALFVRAFNAIINSFVALNNLILRGINALLEAAGLSAIKPLEAFELEAGERAEAIGQRMDEAMAAGIRNQNAAEGALDSILARAEELATKRLGSRDTDETSFGVPLDKLPSEVGGRKKPPADKEAAAFDKVLEDLRKEGDLLRLTNAEREIQQGLLAAEKELKRELTDTERGLVEAQLRLNQGRADEAVILDEIRGPQQDYERSLGALNRLQARGAITTQELADKMRDLRIAVLETSTEVGAGFERGFLKAQRDIEDFASTSEQLITDAFSNAQDAVVDFFKTGEFSADSFFKNLANNFLKLGTQQLFAAGFGQGSAGGGFLQKLLGGGGGGGGLGGFVSGLLGFANGVVDAPVNALSVGNLGGVDNRLVAFRARSDETVSVQRRGQGGGGKPVVVQFNISTPDADSFRRSQGQIMAQVSAVLNRANKRDN